MAFTSFKGDGLAAIWRVGSLMLLGGMVISAWNSPALMPPTGTSLFLKTKTQNGRQIYKCFSKTWVLEGLAGDLVMESNLSHYVGSFSSKFHHPHGKAHSTWVLENSIGDMLESGSKFSSVSGRELASAPSAASLPEALIQATSHQFEGTASSISYIQQLFPKGGDPPMKETCSEDYTKVEVPFEAEYWLLRQEPYPPPTPPSLFIPSAHAVQGLFGEGEALHQFNGTCWNQIHMEASLYNMPGGILAGKYWWNNSESSKSDESHHLQLWNPNIELKARAESGSVQVTTNSLPWNLLTVTHHNGNVSLLGDYTHIQMLSTIGGVPSSYSAFKPMANTLWRAPFSAVFWFYTRSY